MIFRYYLIGSFAYCALLFFAIAFFYDLGWKRGKKLGYEEGLRDGFKEGTRTKEETWWDDAEKGIDQERAKLWRESGAV